MCLRKVMAVLVACLLGACSSGGSGPGEMALEKQLVGHWSTSGDDNLYFGEINPSTKIGSFILVHPDGKVFTHRYKVESADASERVIRTNLLFASGDSREELLVVAKDGRTVDKTTTITGMEIKSQLTRVDDTTAP
jgi:hypothetical protein